MDDAEVVRAGDAAGHLDHERHRAGERDGAAGDDVGESLALEELHHDERRPVVGVALVEDLDDVRVGELLRALGLPPEPLAHLVSRASAGFMIFTAQGLSMSLWRAR